MENITEADITQIIDDIKESGLPLGEIIHDATTVTMRVESRADVETWAEHLGSATVERLGIFEAGYTQYGYSLRVVIPA